MFSRPRTISIVLFQKRSRIERQEVEQRWMAGHQKRWRGAQREFEDNQLVNRFAVNAFYNGRSKSERERGTREWRILYSRAVSSAWHNPNLAVEIIYVTVKQPSCTDSLPRATKAFPGTLKRANRGLLLARRTRLRRRQTQISIKNATTIT